ncbi:MAG: HDOD domain-containing protein [Planctomycetes bacterium]|nr:HDOD domain-containing protein [Planctomycetota bacterium]
MSLKKAKDLVASIEDLPTLPEVVIAITRLVEDPDATAEDIYKIVSTDPALSATMLKLVNSAFYGMSRLVTSPEQAIRILGFVTVRNIALAAFVFDAFLTGKGRFNYKAFWLRSIGTAAAAKVLAHRLQIKETAEYFIYGLLRDMGLILMMQYFADELVETGKSLEKGTSLADAQDAAIGCTHNELGAALAEKWDFPPALISVIRYHSTADAPEEFRMETAVTTCAAAVVTVLEIGESVDPKICVTTPETWETAAVEPGDLGAVMDEVLAEMDNSRSFIKLIR